MFDQKEHRKISMRVCPSCRAEVNDFDSVCEYCGSQLPVNTEFESVLKNVMEILEKLKKFSLDSYNLEKRDYDFYNSSNLKIENIKNIYGESKEIQKISDEAEHLKQKLELKIKEFKKSQYRKTKLLTVLISVLGEFSIFLICILTYMFDKEDVLGFVAGIPCLIGLLAGLGLSYDSGYGWAGAFGGLIVGGLFGYLLYFLVAIPIGQLIFIVGGTISLIIYSICRIKKAKKQWL